MGVEPARAAAQATFDKDNNMQLIPVIRKDFDFSALRDDLNVVATIFDDQTQLTTDRASRSCAAPLLPAPRRHPDSRPRGPCWRFDAANSHRASAPATLQDSVRPD